jgi:hypothetical protein
MASVRGDEFRDELRAARKGIRKCGGKSPDPNFFYFSRHVTHCGKQRREFRALVSAWAGRDQIVCEHRENTI